MAVTDVRDYLLCVENDKAEAFRIAERTSQSACHDLVVSNLDLLTYLQDCSSRRLLFLRSFSLLENT